MQLKIWFFKGLESRKGQNFKNIKKTSFLLNANADFHVTLEKEKETFGKKSKKEKL